MVMRFNISISIVAKEIKDETVKFSTANFL